MDQIVQMKARCFDLFLTIQNSQAELQRITQQLQQMSQIVSTVTTPTAAAEEVKTEGE
jgi:prefoldin subunit 5